MPRITRPSRQDFLDGYYALNRPVVIQGAQHVFHPPVALAPASMTDARSRIVFIVRNIPRAAIESLFAAVTNL